MRLRGSGSGGKPDPKSLPLPSPRGLAEPGCWRKKSESFLKTFKVTNPIPSDKGAGLGI